MQRLVGLYTVVLICLLHTFVHATALDDYVAAAHPEYTWQQTASQTQWIPYSKSYRLELASQSWRGTSEVTPTVWTHWVTVTQPLSPGNTALILINGGNIGDAAPSIDPADETNAQFRNLAFASGSTIVDLRCVPNQPLQFADETFTRSEDEIIAYSWDQFLNGGDDFWPVQVAMVQSVVACMDAVQDFDSGITRFVLAGGSKRGWTAWLTAAVDDRVVAIAPIVSDLLNMRRSFAHHWSCYGFWADALNPYEEMGIFDWFDTPQVDDLLAIVDPFEYLDRTNMQIPKLIVTAAGDDFFVHDSAQFYLDALEGEAYLRTVPNTNHYLDGAYDTVFENMVPYFDAFLNGQSRPTFDWTLNADGSMTITTSETPLNVILWQADNPTARDFRQVTIGTSWTQTPLTAQSPGVYLADPGVPMEGWRSYFVEVVFDYSGSYLGLLDDFDYHFTTEMRVLPEVRPFEADLTRDRLTNLDDLIILADNWLVNTPYYDMMPRRNGDGIINLSEISIFSLHWLD